MRKLLEKILTEDCVVDSINKNLSTILNIIPEISNMIGFEHKHPHHHLDAWEHTLLALSLSENNFKLRLILLLHDIGKPHCYTEGTIRRFKGHPLKSSEMAKLILERLNFDENEINEICYLIKIHDDMITNNFISSNLNLAQNLFKIQFCDALAHHPEKLQKRIKYLESINRKVNFQETKEYYSELLKKYL